MKKLMVVLAVLALTVSANADLLAGWELTGINASANPVFTNTTAGANIDSASTVLRLGSGVTASGTANTFGGTSWGATDYAGAAAADEYISWFVQADAGFALSVTNIRFDFERTSTGISNWVVQSSFDGFTANLFASNDMNNLTVSPSFGVSLAGSNSVEFRLYGWNAGGGAGVARLRTLTGEDLEIQGTVIPEPGTMAMMGLGLLGLAYLRRRIG
jgi:hypothetical protein